MSSWVNVGKWGEVIKDEAGVGRYPVEEFYVGVPKNQKKWKFSANNRFQDVWFCGACGAGRSNPDKVICGRRGAERPRSEPGIVDDASRTSSASRGSRSTSRARAGSLRGGRGPSRRRRSRAGSGPWRRERAPRSRRTA
eukprot:2036408-Alexandrium_andersonii.AAC.1